MKKKLRSSLSLLLSFVMVFSVFTIVPITASAASDYEPVDVTDIVLNASSVSELKAALDGMVTLSSEEAKDWEPPVNSGNERLILYFEGDAVRFAIFINGAYSGNVGTSDYNRFKYNQAKYYYMRQAAPTTHTVTWKNGDAVLKTDTVEEGNAPAYTGTPPEKAEDAENTYTFSGWSDGTNTYGASENLPAVTGDVTYTAQFDATPKAHEHDGITFEKWTSDNSLPTEAGNYVLTSDVTLSGRQSYN